MSLSAYEVELLLDEAELDYRNFHRGKVTEDQVENFRFDTLMDIMLELFPESKTYNLHDCNGVKYMAISQPKPHS